MRWAVAMMIVVLAAVAQGAEKTPEAGGTLGGKPLKFSEKVAAGGVQATVGLLESCHDESLYQADELKKAKQGDHIRLTFPEPITVTVMREKVEVSELVVRLPLGTGVIWVRSGDQWRRYSKYEHEKAKSFLAWLRRAQPAD